MKYSNANKDGYLRNLYEMIFYKSCMTAVDILEQISYTTWYENITTGLTYTMSVNVL